VPCSGSAWLNGVTAKARARAADLLNSDRRFHWEYQEQPVEKQAFRVTGGSVLRGTVRVSGSKNAALKMLAAATLTGERCRFTNVPEIEDVRVMAGVLRDLGVIVDHPAPNTYEVAAGDVEWLFVPLDAAAKMRASFILLGPLLARFGRVIMSNPGGDRIGRRPVNLHVDAMRALGAEIEYRNGYYFARSPGRLRGAQINFPQVTVMGTENAILAATLAEGRSVITPAAQEPEVDDLILMLQKMGAEVARTTPDTVVVEGKRRLRGVEHNVLPDRIEAGTFVVAAAITGGDVTLESAPCDHLGAFLEVLADIGVPIACGKDSIEVRAGNGGRRDYRARDIETAPYPGLATDLQPPTSVLLSQAAGTSVLHETIFEDRLDWLEEFRRLGANVALHDSHHASITGPCDLHAAEVEMGDLRAGASLMLAALAARGTSVIHGAHHVRRGYENIEDKFLDLGAKIERVSEGAE
jgi:UDP-N-acetylglucosamine 1-carboxyvinyltransferase